MISMPSEAELQRKIEHIRELLTGVADAPIRYCKTHGVTTQFKQFDRCIQFELDPTPCRFVWAALVELTEEDRDQVQT